MRRSVPWLLLLGACSHSEPFARELDPTANGPFRNGRPLQLTFNLGLDAWPSFAPGEARVLYSAQDPAPEFDQCVMSLPATGGGATRVLCPPRVADGLTESFDNPVSDGTRLAWVRAVVGVNAQAPFTWSLWMKAQSPPGTPQQIQSFPYDVPSGRVHDLPRFLQWLRPGVLLYLGSEAGGCCRTDTLQFGERAVLLDLTGPIPVRTFVPGTERASAVAGTADGSAIVYTLFGDSLVYRQVLASGAVEVLHNFGSGHVVRDPALSGNTLVAVVDGIIRVEDIPPFGVVQVDKGGLIRAVDLTTGDETAVEDYSHFFRHLRLASAGDRILAEGYPYQLIFVPIGGGSYRTDTTVTLINDVWLWEE